MYLKLNVSIETSLQIHFYCVLYRARQMKKKIKYVSAVYVMKKTKYFRFQFITGISSFLAFQ